MKYRVLRPYGPYEKGQIIEPVGVYRDVLVARGYAEPLEPFEPEAPAVERAVSPPVETATLERATPAKPPKPKKG